MISRYCSYRLKYSVAKLTQSGMVVFITTSDDTIIVHNRHTAATDTVSTSILHLVIPYSGIVGNLSTFFDDAPTNPHIFPDFDPREYDGFKQLRSFADNYHGGEH